MRLASLLTLDFIAEHLETWFPQMKNADKRDADTWTHHAFITGAVFPAFMIPLEAARHGWTFDTMFSRGMLAGVVFGWFFYVTREVVARWRDPGYKIHDGIGDTLHPLWISIPWALSGASARGGLALFVLSWLVLIHKMLFTSAQEAA